MITTLIIRSLIGLLLGAIAGAAAARLVHYFARRRRTRRSPMRFEKLSPRGRAVAEEALRLLRDLKGLQITGGSATSTDQARAAVRHTAAFAMTIKTSSAAMEGLVAEILDSVVDPAITIAPDQEDQQIAAGLLQSSLKSIMMLHAPPELRDAFKDTRLALMTSEKIFQQGEVGQDIPSMARQDSFRNN